MDVLDQAIMDHCKVMAKLVKVSRALDAMCYRNEGWVGNLNIINNRQFIVQANMLHLILAELDTTHEVEELEATVTGGDTKL